MQAQIDREQQELAHARLMMLERAKELANPGDEEGTDATDVALLASRAFCAAWPTLHKTMRLDRALASTNTQQHQAQLMRFRLVMSRGR